MKTWFDRLIGHTPSSAQAAKERLQLVLIHDRTDLSPGVLETLKDEIIAVISKHVDIDAQAVTINLSQNQRESRLIADIPLASANGSGRRRKH
ncbi:MAG: cell division topological specificity factor MinE [Anaerolineales bacterium]|nr:cell division topological specificity factor MinE [Anaerolineales bacterium]